MWSDTILSFSNLVAMRRDIGTALWAASFDARNKYESLKNLDPSKRARDTDKRELISNMGNRDSPGPDYSSPGMVRAYLSNYHVHHTFMVYQIFSTVLKKADLSEFEHMYVCDVGSGIGAGLVGLLLSMERQTTPNLIRFDMIEASMAMIEADEYFYDSLCGRWKQLLKHSTKPKRFLNSSYEMPALPVNTIKVVSAFHLKWPYSEDHKNDNIVHTTNSSSDCLNKVLAEIQPHLCLFTCYRQKAGIIKKAVESYFSSRKIYTGECGVPISGASGNVHTPTGAHFLWGADKSLSFSE